MRGEIVLNFVVSETETGTGGIIIRGGSPTSSYSSEWMGLCTTTFFTVVLSSAMRKKNNNKAQSNNMQ